jgi:hypothetical protein
VNVTGFAGGLETLARRRHFVRLKDAQVNPVKRLLWGAGPGTAWVADCPPRLRAALVRACEASSNAIDDALALLLGHPCEHGRSTGASRRLAQRHFAETIGL